MMKRTYELDLTILLHVIRKLRILNVMRSPQYRLITRHLLQCSNAYFDVQWWHLEHIVTEKDDCNSFNHRADKGRCFV